ncbi:MAG: exopolyphosphatase [Acidaminococcales bacterium]|jgi:nanoRNase/pAp phosphatase (c-di-AMP/oligoRNAs hydrolase)|nr:exopolyphosphatase [Acidaminococcales bacterium]
MRLVTRSDFDGLVCGMLLKEKGIIESWKFVHPKDLQDGLFDATDDDVLANVPYVKGCGLWFDHHVSESERVGWRPEVDGMSRLAPSAARIIYDYYGGKDEFPPHFSDLVMAADKVDDGNLTAEEILNPTGWVLLGFISDPRTGLGRFRNFRISNLQLMEELINHCRKMTIDEILSHPDVKERVTLYHEQAPLFKDMLLKRTRIEGNVIVTDLRDVSPIYAGNRFMIYSLFPQQNISCWVVDGRAKINVSIACGYSVLNRSAKTNVGKLMLQYGGGGHERVGTCQVDCEDADRVLREIVATLRKNG